VFRKDALPQIQFRKRSVGRQELPWRSMFNAHAATVATGRYKLQAGKPDEKI
jgi:hypothetical protein